MHVHMHIGFETKKRNSLGSVNERWRDWWQRQRARQCAQGRQPSSRCRWRRRAEAYIGSPVWVEVGGERVNGCRAAALMSALRRPCGSLNACGNVVSESTRVPDGMFTQ